MSLFEGTKLASIFKTVAIGAASGATAYAYMQENMPLAGAAVPAFGVGIMTYVVADNLCQKVRKHFYQEL